MLIIGFVVVAVVIFITVICIPLHKWDGWHALR